MSYPPAIAVRLNKAEGQGRWSFSLPEAFGLYFHWRTFQDHLLYYKVGGKNSPQIWFLRISIEYPFRHVLYYKDPSTEQITEVFERIGIENYLGSYVQCYGIGTYSVLVAEYFAHPLYLPGIPFPAKFPPNVDKMRLQRVSDWFGQGEFVNAWFAGVDTQNKLIYRIRYYPLIKKISHAYVVGKDLRPNSNSTDLYQYFFNAQDPVQMHLFYKHIKETDNIIVDSFPLFGNYTEGLCDKLTYSDTDKIRDLITIFGGSPSNYQNSVVIGGGYGGIIEVYSNETSRPAPGIIAHWRFDSIKENQIFDSAGLTTGVLIDPYDQLVIKEGRLSNCVYRASDVPGETGVRIVSKLEDLTFGTSSFTIAGWFKTTSPLVYLYDQKGSSNSPQVSIWLNQGTLYFKTTLGQTSYEVYSPNSPEQITVSGITNPTAANGIYYRATSSPFTTGSGVQYLETYPFFKHATQNYYLWYGTIPSTNEKYVILNGPNKTNDDNCFYYVASSPNDIYNNLSLIAYGSYTGNCSTTYQSAVGNSYNDGQWHHFACIFERSETSIIPRIIMDMEQVAYSISSPSSVSMPAPSSIILGYCQGYQIEKSEIVKKPTFNLATGELLSDYWQTEGNWTKSSDSEGNYVSFSYNQKTEVTARILQSIPLKPYQLCKINAKIKLSCSATGSKVNPNDPSEPEVKFPLVKVECFIGNTKFLSYTTTALPTPKNEELIKQDEMVIIAPFFVTNKNIRTEVRMLTDKDPRVSSFSMQVKVYKLSVVPYTEGELAIDDFQVYKRVLDKNDVKIASGDLLPRRECAEGYPPLAWETCAHPNDYTLSGNGTEQSPYLLCSKNNIIQLSNTPSHWDKVFKVTANINMEEASIQPIGGRYWSNLGPGNTVTQSSTFIEKEFCGKIYGQGYTIRNFKNMIIRENASGYSMFNPMYYQGLFGYVANNTTYQKVPLIKDLKISNATIYVGGSHGGVFAGLILSTIDHTAPFIENCKVQDCKLVCLVDKNYFDSLSSDYSYDFNRLGGFAGYAYTTSSYQSATSTLIKDCEVQGIQISYEVVTFDQQTLSYVKHPLSHIYSKWSAPYQQGNGYIHTRIQPLNMQEVGGFVGRVMFAKIQNCSVKGIASQNIIFGSRHVGGFAGYVASAVLVQNEATSNILHFPKVKYHFTTSTQPPETDSYCISDPYCLYTECCVCTLPSYVDSSIHCIGGFAGYVFANAAVIDGVSHIYPITSNSAYGTIFSSAQSVYRGYTQSVSIGAFFGYLYIYDASAVFDWNTKQPIPGTSPYIANNKAKVKISGSGAFRLWIGYPYFSSIYDELNVVIGFCQAVFGNNLTYYSVSEGYVGTFPADNCTYGDDSYDKSTSSFNYDTGYKCVPNYAVTKTTSI